MEGKNLDQIIEKHRKEKPADWSGFDMKPMSELDAGDGASIDDYPMGDGREQRIEKKIIPQKDILDQGVAQQVRSYSRALLEEIYNLDPVFVHNLSVTKLDFKDYICDKIALLVGEEEKHREGYLPPPYREGIKIFLETLICFFQEKSSDKEQKNQLEQFKQIIQEALFSYSPNITNEIGMGNLLITAAKANRVPEAQGWFGQTMVGEMVYELAFADQGVVKNISEKILKLPVAEVLDLIHQCQTIAADAVANGSWAEKAIDRIKLIVEAIQEKHPSPLVHYEADLVLSRIKNEEEEPSLSIIKTTGNKAEGRLNEASTEEEQRQAERLGYQINSESPLENGEKILPVAADAVAIFDHSNLPRSIAYLDFKNLTEPYPISASDLKNAQQFIDDGGLSDINAIPRALYYIDKKILEPNPENAGETVGQRWSKRSQILSESEWNQYFEYYNKLKGQKGELETKRAELRMVAEQKNEYLSDVFLEKFQKTAEELLHNNLGHLNEKLAEELRLFIKYQDKGEGDRAFSAADNFTAPLRFFEKYGSMTDEQLKTEANELLDTVKVEPAEREDIFKKTLNKYEEYRTFYLGLSEEARGLIKQLINSEQELTRQHQLSWQVAEEELEKIISSMEQGYGQIISTQEYLLLNKKLEEKNSQLVLDCQRFLKHIEQIVSEHTLPVNFISYENIKNDNELNPFGGTEADVPLLLQHIDHPALRRLIEKDLGISFLEMERLPQHHLARFLGKGNGETFQRLRSILAENPEYKQSFLNSFVVVAEDIDYGEQLLVLAEKLKSDPAEGNRVFGTYAKFIKESYGSVNSILNSLREEFPDLEISEDLVLQALLSRGKDYFVELNNSLSGDRETSEVVDEFIRELNEETPQEKIVRSQFKMIASLLERNDINLKEFENKQALILKNLMSPGAKALTFRALARMGKLEPIPEIHWRVDRTSEEYNLRFGIDINKFLLLRAKQSGEGKKQTLLEIGPGSGVSKRERVDKGLTEAYQDFALSDKIYYPLSPIIEKLIDFNKLEGELKISIEPEERRMVADFLYKTLVIKLSETSKDKFEYDQGAQDLLAQDINGLKQLLPQLSERLKIADEVPSNISSRDNEGQVIYPNKIKLSDLSLNIKKIKNLLDENLEDFLREDWQTLDYYQLIDAFSANVMIGDIGEIKRLQDGQIDIEIAARSSVYARGEKYQDFLEALFAKLSVGGTTIDDSIRDNDGWYYRIAEVLEARQARPELTNNFEFLVVLGPGFPGEDLSQDRAPLAMYITRDGSSKKTIEECLLPGYELVTIEELANDSHYLESLDKTGLTHQAVRKVLSQRNISLN